MKKSRRLTQTLDKIYWDVHAEKLHLKYCNYILGAHKKASSILILTVTKRYFCCGSLLLLVLAVCIYTWVHLLCDIFRYCSWMATCLGKSCSFGLPRVPFVNCCQLGRAKRIWYLSPMRAAMVQASLRIRAVSPEPPLLAHTSSESRGTFRQKARSPAPLNGWACAVKICHDGMLEDTNSLDGARITICDLIVSVPDHCLFCYV